MNLFIFLIIVLIISLCLFFYEDKKTYIKDKESKKQLEEKIKELKISAKELQDKIFSLKESYLCRKEQEFKRLQEIDEQAQKAYNNFAEDLENQYQQKEQEFKQRTASLQEQEEELQKKIDDIKAVFAAATAAMLQEQSVKDKQFFYQLQIPENQIQDIKLLQEWKYKLSNPSIVSKIIWSSFVIKPTSDLCNRIISSNPCCGIYKITNVKTNQIYIGQSVNISERLKQHIKCGLGIDASATNKLYNNMQEYGVWNFTFELLQKCSRDKLNEKERFWIDMYQSNKIGMNLTKGNK